MKTLISVYLCNHLDHIHIGAYGARCRTCKATWCSTRSFRCHFERKCRG